MYKKIYFLFVFKKFITKKLLLKKCTFLDFPTKFALLGNLGNNKENRNKKKNNNN